VDPGAPQRCRPNRPAHRPGDPAAEDELGKLPERAIAGRQPDSDVTVAPLLDQYVSTAGWATTASSGSVTSGGQHLLVEVPGGASVV
jgi:hypothetical protein